MATHVPTRRDRSPSAVRQAVFAATEQLLASLPLEQLTVRDILSRSGVSRNGFYYHFRSKADVVRALLEEVADELDGQLAALGASPLSSPAWPRQALEAAFALWDRHRAVLLAAQREARAATPLGADWRALVERRWLGPLTVQLEREQAAGRLAAAAPQPLAAALLAATEQALFARAESAAAAPPDDVVSTLALLWQVAAPPPR